MEGSSSSSSGTHRVVANNIENSQRSGIVDQDQEGLSPLLSLPIDSLHWVASFLTPEEWKHLGQTGRGPSRACREVFRRVRMHGFRCATEIVTAWVHGEQSDARELAALYLSSGVPVYPLCLGHSFLTLAWRMDVEVREMEKLKVSGIDSKRKAGDDSSNGSVHSGTGKEHQFLSSDFHVDNFFSERYRSRETDGYYHSNLTYLEEKCLFWEQKSVESSVNDAHCISLQRRHSLASTVSLRPSFRGVHQLQHLDVPGLQRQSFPVRPPRRTLSSSNLPSAVQSFTSSHLHCRPFYSVRIHRHLVDRHASGWCSVDDKEGKMKAAPLSLAADFFHPHLSVVLSDCAIIHPDNSVFSLATFSSRDVDWTVDSRLSREQPGESASVGPRRTGETTGGGIERDRAVREDRLGLSSYSTSLSTNREVLGGHQRVNVALEVYSSSSLRISKDFSSPSDEFRARESRTEEDRSLLSLRSRIASYQRKLDFHLSHHQNAAFDECLLDFWDEFLPSSAMIHFHDGHTPIPRMSSLAHFLSQPCPKNFGTIQCEIERIKTSTAKKGVNVKGRLFPSYQYRLFIRDRREEGNTDAYGEKSVCRNDTVLMTAKNKGKNQSSGPGHSGPTQKRGINNYFLFTPQNRDILSHFNAVNKASQCGNPIQRLPENNSSSREMGREMGRLQSNFIGTEFQIFTPSTKKLQRSSNGLSKSSSFESLSEDDFSSTESQDTNEILNVSPASTSRQATVQREFVMVPTQPHVRRRSNISGVGVGDESSSSSSIEQKSRRRSWPSLRYSRRAIANLVVDAPPPAQDVATQRSSSEEENGAITYTANLLGNRPRIMDVCIPKVTPDGVVSPAWRRHIDISPEDETMMSRFKQLQQHQTQLENTGNTGDAFASSPDEFGLTALQNRPPWWNAELGAFVLNFGGRVSVASVKNFQLCERNNQELIMLQFGRIEGRHSFTMDFQHPLSPIQAFAIAISSLQSKISFG